MQLHDLQPKTPKKKRMTVGRGGKRGKTAGRGTKGQKARAGRKIRPEMRDLIKKLPKLRGRGKNSFKSFQIRALAVNLGDIDKAFEKNDVVSPTTLRQKGLSHGARVKILGGGDLTKTFTFEKCEVSASARQKIEKAGGSIK